MITRISRFHWVVIHMSKTQQVVGTRRDAENVEKQMIADYYQQLRNNLGDCHEN